MDSEKESQLIDEMVVALRDKMSADYPAGETRRDAHPKTIGLLRGEFRVLADIPAACRHGIFESAGSFPCWIRSSSASGQSNPDSTPDLRGLAVKLMGVDGARASNLERQTQDFLFMSIPTMPLGTVKMFHTAACTASRYGPVAMALRFLFSGKISAIMALRKGMLRQSSPLDIPYWSTTPYQCGEGIVKYHIRPRSSYSSQVPDSPDAQYLTRNMASHLAQHDAAFDFYLQFFVEEAATPVEDAAIEWQEDASPFVHVASLQIPRQTFNTTDRFDLAEKLSFSPGNALAEHAPIGGLNRARQAIYNELSRFRHGRDNRAMIEPEPDDFVGTDGNRSSGVVDL